MKRENSLDVIRVLAIWMILNYHFACLTGHTNWSICIFKNGGWGCVGTTMFFLLSGYVLHMKYKDVGELRLFYKKRFLSIFPMFYVTFLLSWVYIAYTRKIIFYGGSPLKLLYTLIGFDGYVTFFGISTYYAGVGEWFTAIIVAIYVLYPIMNWMFKKSKLAGTLILLLFYLWNIFIDPFAPLSVDANLITGLFIFWLGMLLKEYHEVIKKHIYALLFLLPASMMIIFVKLPGPTLIWQNMLGILVFLVLYLIFSKVHFPEMIQRPLNYLSVISYAVYLTHHFLLNIILPKVNHLLVSRKRMLFFYGCYMIIVFVCSVIVNWITTSIIRIIKTKRC